MFDNTMISKTHIKFENHSASGLLCKSMLKSKIIRFDRESYRESEMFSPNPHITINRGKYEEKTINVIVLQVLLVNDTTYIVEYITEDDFNEEMGIDVKEE